MASPLLSVDLYSALRGLIAQIPNGRVSTFGRVAAALGDVTAARWVATELFAEPLDGSSPAHRVVLRDGTLGSTPERQAVQQRLLEGEGVVVAESRVDLTRFVWDDFLSTRPLVQLRDEQRAVVAGFSDVPVCADPQLVAGVDLSYAQRGTAVAAYVLMDVATCELRHSHVARVPVTFPYITGYLSYRELPALCEVIARAEETCPRADVLLVDGCGILHPRRAGIATHLGVALDRTTLGVSKSMPCGRVDLTSARPDKPAPILDGDELLGYAVQSTSKSRPVYVSPGHQAEAMWGAALVQRLFRGHRLPEPTRLADSLSRLEAKRPHD